MKAHRWIIGAGFAASVLVLSMLPPGKSGVDERLYGVWTGSYQGMTLQFTFNKDDTCELIVRQPKSDDVSIYIGRFAADFENKPAALSIAKVKALGHSLHTIIEFIDDDNMKLAKFASAWRLREVAFQPNNTIYLTRSGGI